MLDNMRKYVKRPGPIRLSFRVAILPVKPLVTSIIKIDLVYYTD